MNFPSLQQPSIDEFSQALLLAHNRLRVQHHARELHWDDELGQLAQSWANRIANKAHLEYSQISGVGENITFFPPDINPDKIVEYWYNENEKYEYETPGWQTGTNYFTQVIWKSTEQIGIGKAIVNGDHLEICKHMKIRGATGIVSEIGAMVVVAFYRPAGNNNKDGQFAVNLQALLEEEVVQKAALLQSDGIDIFADVRRQPGARAHYNELSINQLENYFQGDVDLSVSQLKAITQNIKETGRSRQKRKIGKTPYYELWDKGNPISFDFAENIPRETKAKIRDAMRLWQRNTCIRFEENGPSINRIEFFDGGGCSSFVGKVGGTQGISIATPGCDAVGIISHEIGHSLGNFHEQARPDQEQHISVNWNNIPLGRWNNFNPVGNEQADVYGLPYDTGSVMHYGPFGFATDPYVPTIRTIERTQQTTIGQRAGPSFLDYMAINLAYGCSANCPQIPCQRGGYPHPNNCSICQCADGLAGDLCDYVRQSNQDCGGVLGVTEKGIQISSPHYPEAFPKNTECFWLLKAPIGSTILLNFGDEIFDFLCEDTCDKSYVEVKFHRDFRLTGARFCCGAAPRRTFESERNEMLILMRGFGGAGRGFSAFARLNSSMIKPIKTSVITQPSFVIESTIATTTTPTTIGKTTQSLRQLFTLLPVTETTKTSHRPKIHHGNGLQERVRPFTTRITTHGRTLATTTPSPDGNIPLTECDCGDWSDWMGECSQRCGGCGHKQRVRTCSKSTCRTTDQRPCNFKACPEGTNFMINNGEFHILWRGCCVGMFRSGGECAALEGGENPFLRILSSLLSPNDQKKETNNSITDEHGGSSRGALDLQKRRAWLDY
ncbi:unnamed protein product, partial [Mesorhabditis belari]|uniref:Metalloendopeptidase n=1 Tax=Mesorhabditis belari TaxID=2138241 RepID=A0AAF3ENJ9_9BILA